METKNRIVRRCNPQFYMALGLILFVAYCSSRLYASNQYVTTGVHVRSESCMTNQMSSLPIVSISNTALSSTSPTIKKGTTDNTPPPKESSQENAILKTLMSGFAGALIAVILQIVIAWLRRERERYSLLRAVSSECAFNLGVLDEISGGVANGKNGSYKRVKNDFYAELRKVSYRYDFTDDFYRIMAQVACDEDLFIRELEELQNEMPSSKRLMLGRTTLAAANGVRGSLTRLKEEVDRVLTSRLLYILFRK